MSPNNAPYLTVIQVDPPDVNKIPKQDLLGVTVILLTCAYRNREFVRVGYYVNNEDPDAPAPQELMDENGEVSLFVWCSIN